MLAEQNVRGLPSRDARGHQNRGKTPSAESKARHRAGLKRTDDRKGRKSPTWHRHLDPRYREWRLAVFERDAYTCQQCGHVGRADEKGFAAHHILPYATHPEARDDLANGQTLCRLPHSRLHGITVKPRTMRRCACGCGTLIASVDRYGAERRYVNGHNWRGRKRSPEHCAALSAAKKGKRPTDAAIQASVAARKARAMTPEQRRERQAAYDRRRRPAKGGPLRGERHPRAVLTEELVRQIRGRFEQGENTHARARAFAISEATVRQVVHRITWRHVT